VQKDDMAQINRQILDADVIVLSTPTYYYSISAQLKLVIDRTLANQGKMKNKEFYFMVTAADGEEAMETVIADLNGFVACVPGSVVRGEVRGSAFARREIAGSPALERAYLLGKEC
jgi:multimeric flavodoxin WrbA